MIKQIKIQNAPGTAEQTQFNTVAHGIILINTILAACTHFAIVPPDKDFDYSKPGSYLIGNENDLYCILVSDADTDSVLDAKENAEINAAAVEMDKALKFGKVSIDLEFTDSEEKGELIELCRDAILKCTGQVLEGSLKANFEAFIAANESRINRLVNQTKINGFVEPPAPEAPKVEIKEIADSEHNNTD